MNRNNNNTTTIHTSVELIIINSLDSNDLEKIKKNITLTNANKVIIRRNKWVPLHYAIVFNLDKSIIQYLYSITNFNTKDIEENGMDVFAMKHNNINYFDCVCDYNKQLIDRNREVNIKNEKLLEHNLFLEKTINIHVKTINEYKESKKKYTDHITMLENKNELLENTNNILLADNHKLKRKVDETDLAFTNLLQASKKK